MMQGPIVAAPSAEQHLQIKNAVEHVDFGRLSRSRQQLVGSKSHDINKMHAAQQDVRDLEDMLGLYADKLGISVNEFEQLCRVEMGERGRSAPKPLRAGDRTRLERALANLTTARQAAERAVGHHTHLARKARVELASLLTRERQIKDQLERGGR